MPEGNLQSCGMPREQKKSTENSIGNVTIVLKEITGHRTARKKKEQQPQKQIVQKRIML